MSVRHVPAAAAGHRADLIGHHLRRSCRGCDGRDLEVILALGDQPLANAFLSGPDQFASERFYPLDVYFCVDCGLVQLLDVIDADILFRHYLYVTGTSETIAAHNETYADAVVERLGLGAPDLVVEIASNDGSLLACFQRRGVRVLGIEPARNIAQLARDRGIDTANQFFDRSAGASLAASHGRARAIIANNVLAHVDDPVGFLAGCADLLADDGIVFVEVPWALEMLQRGEYDTVYHEHLSYFSVSSLARMAQSAGLTLTHVDRVSVHGGSIRVQFTRREPLDAATRSIQQMEAAAGMTRVETWREFGRAAQRNRQALRELLDTLRSDGRRMAAYGAPAKGNTLLNYCGIGTTVLPWTVDRNPLKVGLFTPGMHLPVRPVDVVLAEQPDYLVILAWNFADEIVRQQQAFADRGGRFIVPIPEPRVV